ncbi:MAG: sensor histidine kinase [Planctomycetota bacterium]|jgi:signal transduction histidine kinase
MRRRIVFGAALAGVVALVLGFGLRAAFSAADAYEARRLDQLDRALRTAITDGTHRLRALVRRSRAEGTGALPFSVTVIVAPDARPRYSDAFAHAERLEHAEGRTQDAVQGYLGVILETRDPNEEVAALRGVARLLVRRGAMAEARGFLRRALEVEGAADREREQARQALELYGGDGLPPTPAEKDAPPPPALARALAAIDPDQVVAADDGKVGWRIDAQGTTQALALARATDVLAASVPGCAEGRWSLALDAGRVLPPPLPPLRLRVSEKERAIVAADTVRQRRWYALPAVLAALLLLGGGVMVAAAARRRERFERRKDAFLCSVTHELKTPIANISLYAETLRDHGKEDTDRVPHFAGIILEETDRLSQRVTEVLDVASGRLALPARRERFDVAAIVRDVCDGRARVNVEGADTALFARGVPALLQRALEGILDNAMKFAEGTITVMLQRAGNQVVLEVDDEGPGIPAPERERVFEAFVRLGDEMTRTVPGTGLGLTLVRQCVEGCGGTVRIEAAENGGTRVVVRLRAQDA